MYHDNIVEHYENPRNVGTLDKKKDTVGTGLVGAPACGDVMKLQIEVDDDGVITDTKFKTFGCGSAIASSSVATEWIKGKTVEEVRWRGEEKRAAGGAKRERSEPQKGLLSARRVSLLTPIWSSLHSLSLLRQVLAIKNTDIAAHLKLPPVKLHCSMLAEDAIHAAVFDYKQKQDAAKEKAQAQA